jgi:beta-glucosidase/6-phospho-beta-glucosidase/beta-galactosidase
MIRYGNPWHRVNPKPHEYDWSWTDQAFDLMNVLGITPIVDLFHYGTPLWVEGGIMNPIFGEMQGWYAKTFAQRYPHITYYTPTNEPYICASFGAEWAIWYPFLRGPQSAARAFKNVTEGICRAMAEVRTERPDAIMMLADTCEYYHSVEGAFEEEATFRSERRFLVHDLYQGLLNRDHPMWEWMTRNDVGDWELDWFLENPVKLDILGLDYYRHSEHQLRRGPNGERIDETATNQFGWAEMARQYSTRYNGIPVFLAETNVGGEVAERVEWFESLVDQTRKARAAGTPVCGLTYYGAIDHVDWDTGLRVRNLNINPCGMWGLRREGDRMVRYPTALVDLYRKYSAMSTEESVGPLASPEAEARVRAVLAPAESVS